MFFFVANQKNKARPVHDLQLYVDWILAHASSTKTNLVFEQLSEVAFLKMRVAVATHWMVRFLPHMAHFKVSE